MNSPQLAVMLLALGSAMSSASESGASPDRFTCLGLINSVARQKILLPLEERGNELVRDKIIANSGGAERDTPYPHIDLDTPFYLRNERDAAHENLNLQEVRDLRAQIEEAAEFLASYDLATAGNPRSLFPIRAIEFRSIDYLRENKLFGSERQYDYLPESGTLVIGVHADPHGGFGVRSALDIRRAFERGEFIRPEQIPVAGLKAKKFRLLWRFVNPMSSFRIQLRSKLAPLLLRLASVRADDVEFEQAVAVVAAERGVDPEVVKERVAQNAGTPSGRDKIGEVLLAQAAERVRAKYQAQKASPGVDVRQFGIIAAVSSVDRVSVIDGIAQHLDLSPEARQLVESSAEEARAEDRQPSRSSIWNFSLGVAVSTYDDIRVSSDLFGGLSKLDLKDYLRAAFVAR